MRTVSLTLAVAVLVVFNSTATADLVISSMPMTLQPGESRSLDILLESDAADGLAIFGFEFQLVSVGAVSSSMEFADPQSDSQLTDSNYVFFENSFVFENSLPVGIVSTSLANNDTFTGGDFTNDFTDETITGSRVLARLDLRHAFPANSDPEATIGDEFELRLVPGSSTLFEDRFGNDIAFSTNFGSIIITAVPESNAWWLVGVSLIPYCWRRRIAGHA